MHKMFEIHLVNSNLAGGWTTNPLKIHAAVKKLGASCAQVSVGENSWKFHKKKFEVSPPSHQATREVVQPEFQLLRLLRFKLSHFCNLQKREWFLSESVWLDFLDSLTMPGKSSKTYILPWSGVEKRDDGLESVNIYLSNNKYHGISVTKLSHRCFGKRPDLDAAACAWAHWRSRVWHRCCNSLSCHSTCNKPAAVGRFWQVGRLVVDVFFQMGTIAIFEMEIRCHEIQMSHEKKRPFTFNWILVG